MTTYEAYGPKGTLLRTFSSRDLAETYRKDMEAIGCVVTIREALIVRRAA
jgi:hypothetical protein